MPDTVIKRANTVQPRKAVVTPHAAEQVADQAAESIKQAGTTVGKAVNRVLDRYEHNVARFVELEHKAANAAHFDWMKSTLNLHATFIEDLSAVYVKTTRAALK